MHSSARLVDGSSLSKYSKTTLLSASGPNISMVTQSGTQNSYLGLFLLLFTRRGGACADMNEDWKMGSSILLAFLITPTATSNGGRPLSCRAGKGAIVLAGSRLAGSRCCCSIVPTICLKVSKSPRAPPLLSSSFQFTALLRKSAAKFE